jgi:lipoate synthase
MKPDLEKCPNGHFRTEATTYVQPKTGKRACRLCKNEHGKLQRLRERERDQRLMERVRSL